MRKIRRKRQSNSRKNVLAATGVAWYEREQWKLIREVAADPGRLENSYEDWVAMAERALSEIQATGLPIEKIFINAADLIAWCGAEGRPIDGAARADFAGETLRRQHASG